MPLDTVLNSPLIERGILIRGAIAGLLEVGWIMFYALAMTAKKERKSKEKVNQALDQRRANGETAAIERFEKVASPERMETLRELAQAAGLTVNCQGHGRTFAD